MSSHDTIVNEALHQGELARKAAKDYRDNPRPVLSVKAFAWARGWGKMDDAIARGDVK